MKNSLLIAILTMCFMVSGANANVNDLIAALNALEDHITGVAPLSGPEIAAHKATIDNNESFFGTDLGAMTAGFDLVDTYDTEIAPLWSVGSPITQFDRTTVSDEDIHWVVFVVMQDIIDYTYTLSSIVTYETFLDGKLFATSAHHPGAVAPPAIVTHTATINASYPDTLGWLRQGDELPGRKPTGTYVAPGTIVTVTVPSALVNNGFQIRVGCHSWDMEAQNRRWIKRMDRMSKVFDITSTVTKVANPLGGGIYIEVPYLASEGVVNIDITGAVRSPYYSYNTVTGHITTLSEWQNTERNHPAPWADFQSEKAMFNVPTDWIYNLDDAVTLMANWDIAMDTMNDLMGFPHDRGKETIYAQVDVIFRGTAYFPGYPTGNDTYNPNTDYGGLANNYIVTGPQYAHSAVFHEQGHAYFFDKFGGETESAVNLHHVSIWNQSFGYDLDYAFAASRGFQNNPYRTLDNTAVTWMACFNFSFYEAPMASGEKAYQLKGHAKFVDIAKLFGWQVIENYYYQLVLENINKNTTTLDDDDRILRMSIEAGVDLTPLFHFWGIHPINPTQLANAIAAENLPESNEIYDRLWYYRSIVPANNAAFQAFAMGWWGHQPSIDGEWTEREHARQWDTTNYWQPNGWDYCGTDPNQADGEIYTEATCARIKAVTDALLAQYFPGGDPVPDLTPPTPDPMTWASVPAPGGIGDPVIEEQFIYEPVESNIDGKNGGIGFDGPWASTISHGRIYWIHSPGLSFSTLPVAGNALSRYGSMGRAEANRLLSAASQAALTGDNTTIWFSALFQAPASHRYAAFLFGTDKFSTQGSPMLGDGDEDQNPPYTPVNGQGFGFTLTAPDGTSDGGGYINALAFNNSSTPTIVASAFNPGTATSLIVGKINWKPDGTPDELFLFNVTNLSTEPAEESAFASITNLDFSQSAFDTLALWDTNNAITDEIRFGTQYSDVVGEGSGSSDTTIVMTATIATDPAGVEYYFDETSGNPGGDDSGWQSSRGYVDTGLTSGTTYTYTVTARDLSPAQNETAPSTAESATTTGTPPPDTDPPTPDPATFASAPAAVSDTEITMTAATGSDATGPVWYYFDETSGNPGGDDSGWTTDPVYNDTGLTASTQYTYTVQMRDSVTPTPNVGTASSPANATTNPPPGPATLLDDDFEGTLGNWSTDWNLVTTYYVSSSHSVECGKTNNDLISNDLNTSSYSSITITFKYRVNDIDANDNVRVQYYNGSGYVDIEEIGDDAEDTWLTYDHTTYDSQYLKSNFRLKIEGSSIDKNENLWVDDVLITVE